MDYNYLVIFSSYINSEEKKNFAINTLTHLKDEGIDVCISTHCNQYLEELSKYAKYVYYDINNELVRPRDFFNNIDYLNENNCSSGNADFFIDFGVGKSSRFIPGPEHSKPALILVRNGVYVANSNNYTWVIYLEYDIPIPKKGYKYFIEDKIKILNKENKECFYYEGTRGHNDHFWGGFFICNTKKLFSNKTLIEENWNLNIQNWIYFWGITPFEYCIDMCLKQTFTTEKIITKRIPEECFNEWGIDNYLLLSRSGITTNEPIPNVVMHLYPYKEENGNFKIFLFIYNTETQTDIKDLKIFIDDHLVYKLDNHHMIPHAWLINEIKFNEENRIVKLEYGYYSNGQSKNFIEEYKLKDLPKIYNYLLQISFNK